MTKSTRESRSTLLNISYPKLSGAGELIVGIVPAIPPATPLAAPAPPATPLAAPLAAADALEASKVTDEERDWSETFMHGDDWGWQQAEERRLEAV